MSRFAIHYEELCDVYLTVKDGIIKDVWLSFDEGFENEYDCHFEVPVNLSICDWNEGIISNVNWLRFGSNGFVECGWTYVSPKNGAYCFHDFATFLWLMAHMGFKPEIPVRRPKQRSEFNTFLANEMEVLRCKQNSDEIDITRLF